MATSSRPRHIHDPEQLRLAYERQLRGELPASPPKKQGMSLTQVQKWVLSTFAVSTVLQFSVAAILTAYYIDESQVDARIGLNVIAAIVGVGAVAIGRMMHQRSPLTWWLLLGLIPGVIGVWVTFA